ncbi:MAG TPA: sulfatase, partial [Spirochaetia bacterium]|nr:sulfatase [Spirochaetia bacterium]
LFKNCFGTNSICEPSRAAILTGTYNHINGVTTIGAHLDNRRENAAKILQQNGYQTAAFGKWHLGEGPEHCPAGFDEWKVLIGQGEYFNPVFIENGKSAQRPGYATDIITDLTMDYIRRRKKDRPFFVQCHHKAPHRPWEPNHIHKTLFQNDQLPLPATLFDDYSDRSRAAQEAEMRIDIHMQYRDLKLIPPPGKSIKDFIPHPENTENFFLVPEETREKVFFKNSRELKIFKYQRYIKDYLRCIASIDENTGRLLDFLKDEKILDDTVIIYTSDQGFFLGDHGWYDKRFMYEESLRMPYIMRYPRAIKAGTVIDEITTNVDFAPTWLDFAGIPRPDYYQGYSQRPLLNGIIPDDWQQSMYYRYWMHLGHYVSAHYGVRTRDYKLI